MKGRMILILVVFFSLISSVEAGLEVSEYSEKECFNTSLGEECHVSLFSYQKYFFNGEEYEEIDENFYPCTGGYCSKKYNFEASIKNGVAKAENDLGSLSMSLQKIFNKKLDFSDITQEGSVVTYTNILPGIDLEYQYLPNALKEAIVIRNIDYILPFIAGKELYNFTYNRNKAGGITYNFTDLTMCGVNYNCSTIEVFEESNKIYVQVNLSFLLTENLTFPVVIDPTLDFSNIEWAGYVRSLTTIPPTWRRVSNPRSQQAGVISATEKRQGGIDWNVSSLTRTDLRIVRLQVYVERINDDAVPVDINHMDGNSSFYPNQVGNDRGNNHFYLDFINGSQYASDAPGGTGFFNFTFTALGRFIMEQFLIDSQGEVWFSHSISSIGANPFWSFASVGSVNATRRPMLHIIFRDEVTVSPRERVPTNFFIFYYEEILGFIILFTVMVGSIWWFRSEPQ